MSVSNLQSQFCHCFQETLCLLPPLPPPQLCLLQLPVQPCQLRLVSLLGNRKGRAVTTLPLLLPHTLPSSSSLSFLLLLPHTLPSTAFPPSLSSYPPLTISTSFLIYICSIFLKVSIIIAPFFVRESHRKHASYISYIGVSRCFKQKYQFQNQRNMDFLNHLLSVKQRKHASCIVLDQDVSRYRVQPLFKELGIYQHQQEVKTPSKKLTLHTFCVGGQQNY